MANTDIFVPWDGWEVVDLIGRGSFGTVYEIRKRTGKGTERAAMKVIPISSDMLDDMYGSQYDEDSARKLCEDSLRNIKKEYDLMYELRGNPNIVRVDDMKVIGHRDGIGCDVYIKMELLTPLQKYQKTAVVTEKDVFALGTDICRALAVCEQHKIIHRDIKPQNILVTDRGTYKLGDFGTARTFEHTVSATMAGTETYMAPEVIRREKYGRDVDTYSLGLVMYRMLNKGQLPFLPVDKIPSSDDRAKSLQRRISGERLPEPATGSPALKAVVMKACSYDRRNRYRSAADMFDDLMMAAEGTMPLFPHDPDDDPTVAEPPTRREKREEKSNIKRVNNSGNNRSSADKDGRSKGTNEGKPRRKLSPVLIVIVLVLAAGVIYGIIQGMQDKDPHPEPEDATKTSTEQSSTTTAGSTTANEEDLAWIQYEMWDYPDKGSGADNSDPNHSNFYTVYYDRDTREFKKIVTQEWFNMEGYDEDRVKDYAERLQYTFSDADFITVNYIGGVTGDFGNQYVLEVEYNDLDAVDDEGKQLLANEIYDGVDWGTTIDEAEDVIKKLGGVRYRASITSEDEAIEWARYFANVKAIVPSVVNFGLMCTDTTTDEAGYTEYLIKGYEDHPENIATIFNWKINEYGEITDMNNESEVNGLQYTN